MSGFGGLLNLDGAPIDPRLLARMADRLAYRGPDGLRTWTSGAVGMVHAHFWTTPEDVGEKQPVGRAERDLWIAADARVDNRPQLGTRSSGVGSVLDSGGSDAEVILAAYDAFGERCCAELVGDFAFALWDGAGRRLLLARDAMGIRQLYYARCGATVVFGSTIGSVLAALPERPELNRNLVEAFLRESYRHWIEGTIFQGIRRIPPGFALTADANGVRLKCWWRLGATFDGSFSCAEEWVEGFRAVLTQAVQSRLRSATRVGLLAGGGLDSAAVSCLAYAELAELPRRLLLVGLTYEETPTADESGYFDELASWLQGVEAERISADRLPGSLGAPENDHPLDEPEVYLLRYQTEALFGGAAGRGCRVVLAGEGANQVLGHAFYHDPRALSLVGWRDLTEELPHFRARCKKSTLELLAHAYLWPRIPVAFREVLRRWKPNRGDDWIRPAGRGSWRRRLPPLPDRIHDERLSPSGRWAGRSIGRPYDLARYSALDVTAAHVGVEWRLPFLDRRVVDLLVHAPRQLRSWRGTDRRILRCAMIDRMPERIRRRSSKSHFKEVLDRLLKVEQRSTVENLVDNPDAKAVDFVSSSASVAFDSYLCGSGDAFGLRPFLALESWLRATVGEHRQA